MAKPRKMLFDVSAGGRRGVFAARHVAGAVAQFRKRFHLPSAKGERKLFHVDAETRGWKGVHVDLIGPAAQQQPSVVRKFVGSVLEFAGIKAPIRDVSFTNS